MTGCHACKEAETNPRTGSFQAGCKACEARALAQSPAAHKATSHQTAVPLQEAIRHVFGADGYREGRLAVWAWITRLEEFDRARLAARAPK